MKINKSTHFLQKLLIRPFFISDCLINPLWILSPPLFVRPDESVIVYPSNEDSTIGFNNGEIIDISCPGGRVSVGGETVNSVFKATCEYGSLLRIFGERIDWNEISSCGGSVATGRYTNKDCDGGKEAVIGFTIDEYRFVDQILLCFDKYNQTTLYTNYDLVQWKSSFKSKPRFPIEDKGFYNVDSQKIFELYTRKVQRNTINKLLGLAPGDTTYIQENDDRFLARGHIAAAADFYYPEQINATYRYINMAPQWQCINAKNWNQVEIDSRNYANSKKVNLKVWAGIFGIATLPHKSAGNEVNLYLYTKDSMRGLPVPALFWKLLYNPEKKEGIVLIVLNNPYLKNPTLHIICTDISTKVSWLKWERENVINGYSYACSVPDFKKVVHYAPDLDVKGLLL